MEKKEKLEILQEVLDSKGFVRAPSSGMLLRYLVESSIDNRDLKEATIGMELYGKKYENDKSEANIRVNVYHLRKKLDKYYSEEGASNPWRIVIKKGQYLAEFEKKKSDVLLNKHKKWKILASISTLLFLISVWFLTKKNYTPLWQDYFDNGKGTTLFIGDFFGVMGVTATGTIGWNRDYAINSIQDYYRFLEINPHLKDEIQPANYRYVTGMAASGTMNISRIFHRNNHDFNIRFSSQTSIKDISENNSIYIGAIKNGNHFLEFFNDNNPKFSINSPMLSYVDPVSGIDTVINLSIDDGSIYEHAVVSRMKGPNNTEQFVFFSDHDIGVMATTEKFSNPDWITGQFKSLIGETDYFTAVFLVKGKERTNIELELLFWDVPGEE